MMPNRSMLIKIICVLKAGTEIKKDLRGDLSVIVWVIWTSEVFFSILKYFQKIATKFSSRFSERNLWVFRNVFENKIGCQRMEMWNLIKEEIREERKYSLLTFPYILYSLVYLSTRFGLFFSQYLLSTDTHIAKFSRISFNWNLRLFRKKTGVGLKREIYFAILLSSFRKEEVKKFLEYEFKQDRNLSDDALV